MEKDIDRITKNPDVDIVIRIDDYGGKKGLTIREFIRGERYTGFTKNGTRVPADKFKQFKQAINSIDEKDLEEIATSEVKQSTFQKDTQKKIEEPKQEEVKDSEDSEDVEEETF